MTLQELKAQHPDLFAEAVEAGVIQERDRVNAHLIMGKSSGDMETAVKAVEEGSIMTQTLTAKYLSAAKDQAMAGARGDDDAEAGDALLGVAATGTPAKDDADRVADAVCAGLDYQEGSVA